MKKSLESMKMLQISFIMTYIVHKILVLLIITRIFKTVFKENKKNNQQFSQHITMKTARLEEDKNVEDNINKDVRNLFRLKKLKNEINYSAIKDIKNVFRLKKES